MRRVIAGHAWTLGAHVIARVRPQLAPPDRPWTLEVPDARYGSVRLSGRFRRGGSDTLVVVIHGLGGNRDSPYMHRAARAIAARGWSCLRLDLRGADGLGEDFYHAGLSADLHATIDSLTAYDRVYVLGYSLGGHMALRFGTEPHHPKIRAIAAVCAPLDLGVSSLGIDRRRAWVYRSHILRGLNRMYREVANRRPVDTPPAIVAKARTIRAWDTAVVVPRFGFASVEDYYAQASVGPLLPGLRVRAAWFGTRHDPMVAADSVVPSLGAANGLLEVRWFDRGGHVGFPDDVGGGLPLEAEVLRWFEPVG